jgi:hypothetical protein
MVMLDKARQAAASTRTTQLYDRREDPRHA